VRHTEIVLAIGVMASVIALPLAAEEPETTPATPVLGSAGARFGPGSAGSLAEVARRIRLQPAEEGRVLEVNDLNLGEIAAEGTISVAEGAVPPPAPRRAAGQEPGETAVEEWRERYGEQADTVKAAEERLSAIDQFRSESRDPYQSGYGAYSQAPGVVSGGQQQRDDAARAVAEERARLDALRREGRRLGATR